MYFVFFRADSKRDVKEYNLFCSALVVNPPLEAIVSNFHHKTISEHERNGQSTLAFCHLPACLSYILRRNIVTAHIARVRCTRIDTDHWLADSKDGEIFQLLMLGGMHFMPPVNMKRHMMQTILFYI